MKFLRIESYKIGILLSTFFNIVNKGLVFFSNLVIAYFFGARADTDVYFFGLNTISLGAAFFTSMNASILVPESMRIREREGKQQAIDFVNFFILFYAVVTLIVVIPGSGLPVQTFHVISNFNAHALVSYQQILSWTVLLLPLMVINNLLSDVMTSYKYFTIPMVVGIINGLLALVAIFFFHSVFGILSAVIGLLFANVVNLFLLILLMRRNLSWNFRFKIISIGKRIWGNIGFAQLGNLTSVMSSYIPLYFFSGGNAGLITALNFAQQIAGLPNTLITVQFSSVSAIKFNELYARNERTDVGRLFQSTAGFLIFILMPVAGLFFIFPNEIISILYKRGAFSGEALQYAAGFLKYLGLILPMLAIDTLFSRLFMASHQIKQSFWYQVICNLVLIGLIAIFINRFGFLGYPFALILYRILNVVSCLWLSKIYFRFLNYSKVLKDLLLLALCNAAIVLLLLGFKNAFSFLNPYLLISIVTLFYGVLLLLINEKFHLNQYVKEFVLLVRQKLKFSNGTNTP